MAGRTADDPVKWYMIAMAVFFIVVFGVPAVAQAYNQNACIEARGTWTDSKDMFNGSCNFPVEESK